MKTNPVVASQKSTYETIFSPENLDRWKFHTTENPLTRFIRDQGLYIGLKNLQKELNVTITDICDWKVLVVCGGVGGEGIFLRKYGFRNVTVSDFAVNALKICNQIAPDLKTIQLNAEDLELDDDSYDFLFVRAGLHHLSRPTLGYTEMLRVARRAVMFFEPHTGVLGKWFGDEFENQDGVINYVFRWNENILEQVTKSYLLENFNSLKCLRYWNHPPMISKSLKIFPGPWKLPMAKTIYSALNTFFPYLGNSMIGIVVKRKNY